MHVLFFLYIKKYLITAYIKTILNDFRHKKEQLLSLDCFIREQRHTCDLHMAIGYGPTYFSLNLYFLWKMLEWDLVQYALSMCTCLQKFFKYFKENSTFQPALCSGARYNSRLRFERSRRFPPMFSFFLPTKNIFNPF